MGAKTIYFTDGDSLWLPIEATVYITDSGWLKVRYPLIEGPEGMMNLRYPAHMIRSVEWNSANPEPSR